MRRTLKKNLRRKRSRGGGWSTGPGVINAGNLEYIQYAGPGKDCTGNAMSHRPGWISDPSFKGLPGMAGGKRRSRRTRGGTIPGVASESFPVTNPNMGPVSGSLTPKPAYFPDPTGAGGTVGKPEVLASWPGVPSPQRGGRYGFFPGMGPLNPSNGVGVSPPFFGRIACEAGTTNPLNLNPNGIQTLTTAPSMPPVMRGGSAMSPAPYSGASNPSAANFPTVQVGQADSMRYYVPTAGYRNDFETMRAPSAVGGLTIQTPYDARAFNQACIKTGGSRRNKRRNRGGAMPVAATAAEYSRVTMDHIGNRGDFDGSKGGLPVKFGGSRKNRKKNRK